MSNPTREELHEFADRLERRGIFARRYELSKLIKLYHAAKTLHGHLSQLDVGRLETAEKSTLATFANAYAVSRPFLRRFGDENAD